MGGGLYFCCYFVVFVAFLVQDIAGEHCTGAKDCTDPINAKCCPRSEECCPIEDFNSEQEQNKNRASHFAPYLGVGLSVFVIVGCLVFFLVCRHVKEVNKRAREMEEEEANEVTRGNASVERSPSNVPLYTVEESQTPEDMDVVYYAGQKDSEAAVGTR